MLMLLILLGFAYIQDNFGKNFPTHFWAIVYSLVNMGAVVLFGDDLPTAVISSLILGGYAWGYFLLLRRFGDGVLWWTVLCVLGMIIPFFLPMILT